MQNLTQSEKYTIKKTFAFCLLVALFTFPKHYGFMLQFVLIFLVPVLLVRIFRICTRSEQRKQRIIQVILWVVTCLSVIIHHIYLYQTTQNFANRFSDAVIAYHNQHGVYPNSADELDIDKQLIEKYDINYNYQDNQPYLCYRSTWRNSKTEHFNFDFEDKTWGYLPS
ncbi:MAG: hypothetical protein KGV51_02085 [Moraxellaceae bacterium]|nr:hypothetical protein [Moraxellaceae bacterium]